MSKKTISLVGGYPIEHLEKQKDLLLPGNKKFSLVIDYPCNEYIVEFTTPAEGMGLGGIMGQVGKAYKKIYANPDKHGVWGHDIGDLMLESVTVNFTTNKITLRVGS